MEKKKVLIADDEAMIAFSLSKVAEKAGFISAYATGGTEAMNLMKKNGFDVVVLDIKMNDMTGIDVIREMKKEGIAIPVIILSAYSNVNYVVEATKLGAYDYLVKPVDEEKFILTLNNAIESARLKKEVDSLRSSLRSAQGGSTAIIGNAPAFAAALDLAYKAAGYNVSVLIQGESGTGKELFARSIHNNSVRKEKPFISIDCAALPESLIESELFGHEKGAYTDAKESKAGLFEQAAGGTIFLDEIGNLSVNVQKKLLRVLQEREIGRVGGTRKIKLDIRVITATNADLKDEVKKGLFRDDLYHRINEFFIEIPPLRKRGDDVMLLTKIFIAKYSALYGKTVTGMDEQAREAIVECEWRGNVRELENTIKYAVIMADGLIEIKDLPANFCSKQSAQVAHVIAGAATLKKTKEEKGASAEKALIIKTLEECKWNKKKAAKVLAVDYKTLYNKIKKYGI